MATIRTVPCEDQYGNRYWKNEECQDKCIAGNKESMIPEICPFYSNRIATAKDVNFQLGARIEECSDPECKN